MELLTAPGHSIFHSTCVCLGVLLPTSLDEICDYPGKPNPDIFSSENFSVSSLTPQKWLPSPRTLAPCTHSHCGAHHADPKESWVICCPHWNMCCLTAEARIIHLWAAPHLHIVRLKWYFSEMGQWVNCACVCQYFFVINLCAIV